MPRPSPISKTEKVNRHLKTHGSISSSMAAARYDVWHLADIIQRLRERGMEIETLTDFKGDTKYQARDFLKNPNGRTGKSNGDN